MYSLRQRITMVGVLALVGAGAVAAAPTLGTAPPSVKPVIGRPVGAPPQPVAGRRFTVFFRVTRGSRGAGLSRATMICDPSVGGVVLPHAESFAGGVARLSLVVPETAAGRVLKVKLTIKAAGGPSVSRVALFHVETPPPPVPSASIGDVSGEEGNGGTATFSFPITLSAATTRTVLVDYATADGTAVAPSDYMKSSGTLTFTPGETAKSIPIPVVGDLLNEATETFKVILSNPFNATIARGTATGTVLDDEVVLVSPAPNGVLPQNVPTSGCAANPTHGYGWIYTFAWRTNHRPDISALRLLVQHRGATLALVSVVLGAEATSYTTRGCDAFVADQNLTDWEWSVTAIDGQGNTVARAQASFAFAPCRLADGTACRAP